MTMATADTDLVSRFKAVKEKIDIYHRQAMEIEAKKKVVEDQINVILAELETLGIKPADLKTHIASLEQDIASDVAKLEDLVVKAENGLKENA